MLNSIVISREEALKLAATVECIAAAERLLHHSVYILPLSQTDLVMQTYVPLTKHMYEDLQVQFVRPLKGRAEFNVGVRLSVGDLSQILQEYVACEGADCIELQFSVLTATQDPSRKTLEARTKMKGKDAYATLGVTNCSTVVPSDAEFAPIAYPSQGTGMYDDGLFKVVAPSGAFVCGAVTEDSDKERLKETLTTMKTMVPPTTTTTALPPRPAPGQIPVTALPPLAGVGAGVPTPAPQPMGAPPFMPGKTANAAKFPPLVMAPNTTTTAPVSVPVQASPPAPPIPMQNEVEAKLPTLPGAPEEDTGTTETDLTEPSEEESTATMGTEENAAADAAEGKTRAKRSSSEDARRKRREKVMPEMLQDGFVILTPEEVAQKKAAEAANTTEQPTAEQLIARICTDLNTVATLVASVPEAPAVEGPYVLVEHLRALNAAQLLELYTGTADHCVQG